MTAFDSGFIAAYNSMTVEIAPIERVRMVIQ